MDSLLPSQPTGLLNLLDDQTPWSPTPPAGASWLEPPVLTQGEVQLQAVTAIETSTSGDKVPQAITTTYSLASGDAVTGYVASKADRDWYKVTLTAGVRYTFGLSKIDTSGLDCYLRLLNSSGTQIAVNDDSNGTLNSQIIYTPTASGTFYLEASSYAAATSGQYSLSASIPTAGYSTTTGYGEVSAERAIEKLLGIQITDLANQFSGGLYGLDRIGAPEAWNAGYTGSGIVVAVVDTGVDRNHPDLAGNIWSNTKEIANNGKDDDNNGFIDDVNGWNFSSNTNNTFDDNRHGTHVSGTIAGLNNGVGVTGVAYGAKIMPVKVLDAAGSGSLANVARGIRYAADNGAHVINLSLGGSGSAELQSAVQYAWNKGVAVIMAAGNNGSASPIYPAAYATTTGMAIGAVDGTGALATFSNKAGSTVLDYVTAAGVSVYSTLPNNTYGSLSGTSMATPGVAGAMALLMEANKRLATPLSLAQLEALFTSTASNMLIGTAGTASTTTTSTTTTTRTASTTSTPRRGASLSLSLDSPSLDSPSLGSPSPAASEGVTSAASTEAPSADSSPSAPLTQAPSGQPGAGELPQPALDAMSPMAEAGSAGMDSDALTNWLPWARLMACR